MAKTRGELYLAFKKEKDPKVRSRMLAVHIVRIRGFGIDETAENLMQCPNRVRMWVERYDLGGLDSLRDLPRSGRPRYTPAKASDRIISDIGRSRITPVRLQQAIREKTGRKLHITYVRKIMRGNVLSPKASQKIHIRRASGKAVRNWQYDIKKWISRMESEGFTVLMEDEAFFIHDAAAGRKYWSPVGSPVTVSYTGSHRKIAVYGSVARDGRQFFRTYDRFDSETFAKHLKDLQAHFGRVAVITDRASPHRARLVRELLKKNRGIRIRHFPKGSPYLNAVEECWHQGKRILLVSEYYETFSDLCRAASLYYRTRRFNLELLKYANRKPKLFSKNF